jgi:hypoxanthine phosphoribosyltransferase
MQMVKDSEYDFKYIVIVATGAFNIGSAFKKTFKNTKIVVIIAESYVGTTQHDLRLSENIASMDDDLVGNALIVDDIADSGRTFIEVIKFLAKNYPNLNTKTAALCKKDCSAFNPNYCVDTYSASTWVVFPWEIFE